MSKRDLKLLAKMLEREKVTPQQPASMGEKLDAERWRGKEADPAAEAVLGDYIGEGGGKQLGENSSQMRARALGLDDGYPAKHAIDDARQTNAALREAKATPALVRDMNRPGASRYVRVPEPAVEMHAAGGWQPISEASTTAARRYNKELAGELDRDFWRAVDDPDILPMSAGAPAAIVGKPGPEEGPGVGYLRRAAGAADSLLPADNLEPASGALSQEQLDALAKTTHGRLMGSRTMAERAADKQKGIGPMRRLFEQLLREYGNPESQGGSLMGKKR